MTGEQSRERTDDDRPSRLSLTAFTLFTALFILGTASSIAQDHAAGAAFCAAYASPLLMITVFGYWRRLRAGSEVQP